MPIGAVPLIDGAVPSCEVRLEIGARPDDRNLAACFHLAVPRELALRHRPRLLGGMPARQWVGAVHVTGDLGAHAQPDPAAPHLGERHGAASTIGPILQVGFTRADFVERPREVAVPLERVHGQIKMTVE